MRAAFPRARFARCHWHGPRTAELYRQHEPAGASTLRARLELARLAHNARVLGAGNPVDWLLASA